VSSFAVEQFYPVHWHCVTRQRILASHNCRWSIEHEDAIHQRDSNYLRTAPLYKSNQKLFLQVAGVNAVGRPAKAKLMKRRDIF
jgi:hypothetical protein